MNKPLRPRHDSPPLEAEELLTPSEVAQLFRVDAKTVTRWAKNGRLSCIRTLGGHRRYRSSEIYSLLASNTESRISDDSDA